MLSRLAILSGLVSSLLAISKAMTQEQEASSKSADDKAVTIDGEMITESSISVQMSYIFGPSFHELKTQIGSEADGEVDWHKVRQHALIISEATSRLHRWPDVMDFESKGKRDKYRANWEKNKLPAVKASAHELYQLAKLKEVGDAKKKLGELATNCNICHQRSGGWSRVNIEP